MTIMAGFGGKIKSYIMSLSYQERRKKKLEHYRQELVRLQGMEEDELHFEYISLKSEYEHRKSIVAISLFFILLSVFRDVWGYFFSFMEKLIQYAVSGQDNGAGTAKIVFVVFAVIVASITVIVFGILIVHIKRMRELNRSLMVVEEVKRCSI